MIPPKGFLCVGIYAARHGGAAHEIGEIIADNKHDSHADQHGYHSAGGTGDGQEGGSGHGKHTPSHHTAESKGPDIQWRQVAIKRFDAVPIGIIHLLFAPQFPVCHSDSAFSLSETICERSALPPSAGMFLLRSSSVSSQTGL